MTTVTTDHHPGRKGDWLAYGAVDVYIPPEEATRRRPARGART